MFGDVICRVKVQWSGGRFGLAEYGDVSLGGCGSVRME